MYTSYWWCIPSPPSLEVPASFSWVPDPGFGAVNLSMPAFSLSNYFNHIRRIDHAARKYAHGILAVDY